MAKKTKELEKVYKKTHWGHEGEEVNAPKEVADLSEGKAVLLGRLVSITYQTAKGSDEVCDWEHEFGPGELPDLCFVPAERGRKARLVIAGGDYTVTTRGIEG